MSSDTAEMMSVKPMLSGVVPQASYAPVDVPNARRRETLAALFYCTTMWQAIVLCLFALAFPILWPLIVVYLGHIYLDKRYEQGGSRSQWFRKLFIWRWLADYFPAQIIKEADLDPARNYIFGYHPHGIICTGAFVNFCTEATGVEKIFPGLNIRFLTLNINFYLPFYREYILALGKASVSKESILNIIGQGPGHSCMIVVGGAEESLRAKPELNDLVLAKRFGFVSLAIKTGTSLVPVYGFGENHIYDQVVPDPGSFIQRCQQKLKQLTGFTLPLFFGRGIFNYSYGVLPRRHPLNIVVGKPIHNEKDENPSIEKVQQVHKQYMEALEDLYNRNKDKYCPGATHPPMKFI